MLQLLIFTLFKQKQKQNKTPELNNNSFTSKTSFPQCRGWRERERKARMYVQKQNLGFQQAAPANDFSSHSWSPKGTVVGKQQEVA